MNNVIDIVRSCESSWRNESTLLRSSKSWLQLKLEIGMSFLETLITGIMLMLRYVATPIGNLHYHDNEPRFENVLDAQQFLSLRSLRQRRLSTFHRSLTHLGLSSGKTSVWLLKAETIQQTSSITSTRKVRGFTRSTLVCQIWSDHQRRPFSVCLGRKAHLLPVLSKLSLPFPTRRRNPH